MTKEEFEAYYAANSRVSIGRLRELGLIAVLCDCGEEGCRGWQMSHIAVDEEQPCDDNMPMAVCCPTCGTAIGIKEDASCGNMGNQV